jgi:hypothetical protein
MLIKLVSCWMRDEGRGRVQMSGPDPQSVWVSHWGEICAQFFDDTACLGSARIEHCDIRIRTAPSASHFRAINSSFVLRSTPLAWLRARLRGDQDICSQCRRWSHSPAGTGCGLTERPPQRSVSRFSTCATTGGPRGLASRFPTTRTLLLKHCHATVWRTHVRKRGTFTTAGFKWPQLVAVRPSLNWAGWKAVR